MARDDDGDGVPAVGGTHGAGDAKVAQPARQLAVAQRRPIRDDAQGIPYAPLKCRAGRVQWDVERPARPGEVLRQLLSSASQQFARGAAAVVLHPSRPLDGGRSMAGDAKEDPREGGARGCEHKLTDGAGDAGGSSGHTWTLGWP